MCLLICVGHDHNVRVSQTTLCSIRLSLALAAAVSFVTICAASSRIAANLLPPTQLQCDAKTSPLAINEAHPEFSWQLTAATPFLRNVRQTTYRVLVASSAGMLAHNRSDLWDSGEVSSASNFGISYEGSPLAPSQQVFWKVRVRDNAGHTAGWSTIATFTSAPKLSFDNHTFAGARWIASPDSTERAGADHPMPIFRHNFMVEKTVRRALLDVTGLGQYQVRINDRATNADVLAPGWSDFRKTIFFDTYDITALLHRGPNAIGILLGNGMYNVQRSDGRFTKFTGSFGVPKCIASLRIEFTDGSVQMLGTDASWLTASSPVTFSSIYGGEDFDARNEPAGWDAPLFADKGWKHVATVDGPGGALSPELAPHVEVMHLYKPIHQTTIRPGVVVYDLGQNFAGWPRVTVDGQSGAIVKMICGELLNSDGTISQRSSGGKRGLNAFTYTLGGAKGSETWHPLFAYYGFRYVQIELSPAPGRTNLPRVHTIVGEALHSSRPDTGWFTSSNPMLNQIHNLIVHAMENNTVSIFTDCPHREKLGWLEETQLMAGPLMWNADVRGVYAAEARDIADAQRPDGMVPTIAPQYTSFKGNNDNFNDSPEWGSAATLDPWLLYQRYGDKKALRHAWPVMQRYVDYLHTRATNGIVNYGLGDWYDIGPGSPGLSKLTTLGVTATATYYQDLLAMRDSAIVLGYANDATHYAAEAEYVKTAFNSTFWDPQKQWYDRGSQTAQSMPLALGMVPEDLHAHVLQVLVSDIHAHQNHVTSGEVGFAYTVRTLIQNRRGDVLLAMLQRTDPPSYGSQLAAGATSLTEAWDANPHSSQDHFMLGDADDWFYQGLGGLDIDFGRTPEDVLRIDPEMLPGVPSGDITYNSVLGTIECHWKQLGTSPHAVQLRVAIPPNTQAWVKVGVDAMDGSFAASKTRGVLRSKQEEDNQWLLLGSGIYDFSW